MLLFNLFYRPLQILWCNAKSGLSSPRSSEQKINRRGISWRIIGARSGSQYLILAYISILIFLINFSVFPFFIWVPFGIIHLLIYRLISFDLALFIFVLFRVSLFFFFSIPTTLLGSFTTYYLLTLLSSFELTRFTNW